MGTRLVWRRAKVSVLAINGQGGLFDVNEPLRSASPPPGLRITALDVSRLLQGKTVSGTRGSIVFAAAPFSADVQFGRGANPGILRNPPQGGVLTRRPPTRAPA